MMPTGTAVRSVTGSPAAHQQGGLGSGGGGPPGPTNRVVSPDFSTTTGWSPTSGAWTVASGSATNNTAMQDLTGTLSPALAGGETVDVVVQKSSNPAGTSMVIQLYDVGSNTSQLIYNDVPPGGVGAGTITIPGVSVSGPFDRIRFRALDDAGIVLDSASLVVV